MKPVKLNKYAKIAGITYILVILLGIFSVNIIEPNIINSENNAETFQNIIKHEFTFRLGVVSELLMYVLVLILSIALYIILKTVEKNLALFGLIFRVGEALVGTTTVIFSGIIPILFLKPNDILPSENLYSLNSLFLEVRGTSLDIVLLFIGIGGTLFCYLFYRSDYVPKILSGWGIFTYLSMLLLSITSLLLPISIENIKMIFFMPGALFEIIFGLWLILKGINLKNAPNQLLNPNAVVRGQ